MATDKKDWFESGYTGADRESEKRALGNGPKRWWMRGGTTKQIVMLDDEPTCFDEHSWNVGDSKFPVFGTCLTKIEEDPCPGCTTNGVGKADYIGHLTAIDIDGYVMGANTPKEKKVQFELVEFAPKLRVMNRLKQKKENKGSLIGELFKLSRADENAPNTGDDFDYQRPANMEALYDAVTYHGKKIHELITTANGSGPDAAKTRRYLAHNFQIPEEGLIPERIPVFNYRTLHAPMTIAEFRRAVVGARGFAAKGSGGGGSSGSSSDETVPF